MMSTSQVWLRRWLSRWLPAKAKRQSKLGNEKRIRKKAWLQLEGLEIRECPAVDITGNNVVPVIVPAVNQPGELVHSNQAASGLNPAALGFSSTGVRYFDGTLNL